MKQFGILVLLFCLAFVSLAHSTDAVTQSTDATSTKLELGSVTAIIQPEAVSGFNLGNMMNIVENKKALLELQPRIVRFPAGNVGDDQDMNASSMRVFAINLKLLEQNGIAPKVIVQTRAFQGAQGNGKNQPEDAALAAKLALENKIKVDYWSVGNEPNLYAVTRGDKSWTVEKYCNTFKAHRKAILEVQPTAKFAGPSTTGDAGFLEEFVRLCGDQIDVLTWHVYPTDGRATDEVAIASIARVDNEREQYMTLWKDPLKNPLAFQKQIGFGLTEYGLSYRTESNRHIGDQLAGLWAAETTLRMASAGATLNTYFALQGIAGHGTLDISGIPRATYYAFRHLTHFRGQALEVRSSNPNLWLHAAQQENRLTVMASNTSLTSQLLETNLAGWQLIGIKGFTDATVKAEKPDTSLALVQQIGLPARSFWRLVYQKPVLLQKPASDLVTVWREGNYRAPPAPEFATKNFSAPYPTNAWWGSLLWEKFSGALVAQPFSLLATANGMAFNYPELEANEDGFSTPFAAHITVGLTNGIFPDARVDGASDFVVRSEFRQDKKVLHATFGHGLPFVWFEANQEFKLSFLESPQIWARPCVELACNALGLRLAGRDYVVFTALGVKWRGSGNQQFVSGGRLVVAALPEEAQQNPALRLEATAFLAEHLTMPTDSNVSWRWDAKTGQVLTTHRLETDAKTSLMGLYPHQWKNTKLELSKWSYVSARGQIRLVATNSFTTSTPYTGILPNLPLASGDSQTGIRTALFDFVARKQFFPLSQDSIRITDAYTDARNFGRLTQMLEIALQLNETEAAKTLLAAIKERLEEWFDPAPPHALLWDQRWGTVIPVPASHGVDHQLNDHHFNFGYFLQAAASLAEHDPAWLEKHRAVLDVLAREVAAGENDPLFTKTRNFDAYAGHSWASGDNRGRMRGANQESSSEAINAWAGLIRYAQASQNPELLERAIGLYALETNAIWQYWFATGGNFPVSFAKSAIGILWGDGGQYGTWWTGDKGAIHLINALPLTGASLYLAREKGFVEKNFVSFSKERYWNDLAAMYLALGNPTRGFTEWNQELRPEFGNSLAQTKHWLASLQQFGIPNQSIIADVAQFAVLEKENIRTYFAYNSNSTAQIATFSDGMVLAIPAGRYAQISKEVKQ
jgi:endoglucanase Acf2